MSRPCCTSSVPPDPTSPPPDCPVIAHLLVSIIFLMTIEALGGQGLCLPTLLFHFPCLAQRLDG